jgi:hypothetical protein
LLLIKWRKGEVGWNCDWEEEEEEEGGARRHKDHKVRMKGSGVTQERFQIE